MGDDHHREGQINCSFHPGVKPAHSSPEEPDVRRHDRSEEGNDQDHELEEELKTTCDVYEEEMTTLVEQNDDLKKKLKVFMGYPAPGGEDDDSTCPENYIIIKDTDSDPDHSGDDLVDEAGADIMEASSDQFFYSTTITVVVFPHVYSIVQALFVTIFRSLYALL